jgi:hypothetical protein
LVDELGFVVTKIAIDESGVIDYRNARLDVRSASLKSAKQFRAGKHPLAGAPHSSF